MKDGKIVMNVGFVAWRFESLGLQYLSASVKQCGHRARLYFDPSLFYDDHFFFSRRLHGIFDVRDSLVQNIIDEGPDLLCFSVQAGNYGWACDIAAKVKKRRNIPVVFGGIHPTSVPESVLSKDFVDYICIGEGEDALVELIQAMEKKRSAHGVRNIWFKENNRIITNSLRPLRENLDSLPLPDKDLFFNECSHIVSGVYVTLVSRGCYYCCSYCCHDSLAKIFPEGKGRMRVRSVDNVLCELAIAKKKYKPRWIYFNDDLFPSSLSWTEEFSRRYSKEIGIPFGINSHILQLNEQYVSLLAQAGCASLDIGIQSADVRVREEMLNRYMDNKKIATVIAMLKSYNLYVYIDMMLGISEDLDADLYRTLKSIKEWKPDGVGPLFLSYFPRTSLTEKAYAAGLIGEEKMRQINDPIAGSQSFVIGGDVGNKSLFCAAAYYQLVLFLPWKVVDRMIRMNILKHFSRALILRFFTHFIGFIRRLAIHRFKKRQRCFRFSMRQEALFYITYLQRWLLSRCRDKGAEKE